MATVYLPLSSLSRKILVAEYGAEPIAPGRADWMSDVLRVDRRDTQFQARALELIRSGVLLSVSPALADRVTQQAERLGVVLHRLHIEMLTRIMLAASESGQPAKTAMQCFYDAYDLDEDDLSQESAYREYQRFRKTFFERKQANSAKKNRAVVTPDSRIWQGASGEKKTTYQHPTRRHLRPARRAPSTCPHPSPATPYHAGAPIYIRRSRRPRLQGAQPPI